MQRQLWRPRSAASVPAGAFQTPRVGVGARVDAGDRAARRRRRAAGPRCSGSGIRSAREIDRRVGAAQAVPRWCRATSSMLAAACRRASGMSTMRKARLASQYASASAATDDWRPVAVARRGSRPRQAQHVEDERRDAVERVQAGPGVRRRRRPAVAVAARRRGPPVSGWNAVGSAAPSPGVVSAAVVGGAPRPRSVSWTSTESAFTTVDGVARVAVCPSQVAVRPRTPRTCGSLAPGAGQATSRTTRLKRSDRAWPRVDVPRPGGSLPQTPGLAADTVSAVLRRRAAAPGRASAAAGVARDDADDPGDLPAVQVVLAGWRSSPRSSRSQPPKTRSKSARPVTRTAWFDRPAGEEVDERRVRVLTPAIVRTPLGTSST